MRLLDDAVAWAAPSGRPVSARAHPRASGTDERPIEIPWCLARYGGEPRLLDVGYVFAEPGVSLALVALGADRLVGVDLASADVPGSRERQSRPAALPFDSGTFDVAIAISTLEHVGQDNSQYGLSAEQDSRAGRGAPRAASGARRRRASARHGADGRGGRRASPRAGGAAPATWVDRFEAAGFLVWEDELYELGDEGWQSVTALSSARYGERGPGASAVLCAELRPARLGARLRLAVRDRRHADEPRRAI